MDKEKEARITNTFFTKFDRYMTPFDLEPEERSKRLITGIAVICTIPFLLLFAVIQFLAQQHFFGFLLLSLGILVTISFFFGRRAFNIAYIIRANIAAVGLLFLYMFGTSENYPNRLLWS